LIGQAATLFCKLFNMDLVFPHDSSAELMARKPQFAILPIGSFEQHGHHLPMTTDTLIAGILGKALSQALNGLLLSPITISCSQEHEGFFGSTYISADTLTRMVKEIVHSLEESGICLTVMVNAHGGNYVLRNVAQEVNLKKPQLFLFPTSKHWQEALTFAGIESSLHDDMHAGEIETSILLHACPEVVRLDKVKDHAASERSLLNVLGMKAYTESGVIGFPSLASANKGQLLIEGLTKAACKDLIPFLKEH
jgi:creatinine amidohydrolase